LLIFAEFCHENPLLFVMRFCVNKYLGRLSMERLLMYILSRGAHYRNYLERLTIEYFPIILLIEIQL